MDVVMECHHNTAVVVVVVAVAMDIAEAANIGLVLNIVATREVITIAEMIDANENVKDREVVAIAAAIVDIVTLVLKTRSQWQAIAVAEPDQDRPALEIEAVLMSMNRPFSIVENTRDLAPHKTDLGLDLDPGQSPAQTAIWEAVVHNERKKWISRSFDDYSNAKEIKQQTLKMIQKSCK